MDVESAQVHFGDDKMDHGNPGNTGTPVNASVLSASTPEVWVTPAAFSTDKFSSFREIISMPSLNIDVKTKLPNGDSTSKRNEIDHPTTNGDTETLDGSYTDNSQDATPDISEAVSPVSNIMIVPPNTPQINVVPPESGLSDTVLSIDITDVTVYEKTPKQAEFKVGHNRSLSGVNIVTPIEINTGTQTDASGTNQTPVIVITGSTPEKSLNNIVIENVVASGDSEDNVLSSVVPVVNGSVEGAQVPLPANEETLPVVHIPLNDRSGNVSSLRSGSEAPLVSHVHDCEDLLGGFLVRPCPSMRRYRRQIAKGFAILLLVLIVAIVIVSFLLNRMQ